MRKWSRENKEKVKGYCKKYYNRPEIKKRLSKQSKKYYWENRDKCQTMNQEWRKKKKEEKLSC